MAEENLNHNENDSPKSSALHPVGEDNIKREPCEENLNFTGNDQDDIIETDDEENEKGEKEEHSDLACKVEEEKKSPEQNDHVSSPKSSAGDEESTAKSSTMGLDPKRGPEDAWNEIKTQETHCLYCAKCKSNITKDSQLFKKGHETDQYKTKPFVIWIPLLFPSFLPQFFSRNTPGLWEKLKKVFLNWLTFLRFLLVLLLISVIVLLVLRQNDEKIPSLPTPMYIKYLPVIATLFLAILAVPWRSIPVPYPDILRKYIVVPIQNLDIVKSIVYGGLIESITSLGVVSCAAGSGTSTLNVLALGIANLITGLILIIHKLCGLITNQPRYHNANNEDHVTDKQREALYNEMLGKREKVKLHCVVVVVSFIFFGMVPPFFYGLSFKRNDEGLYKAAFVLSASLGCVMSLSFAKAYAFDMKKRWTVPVYTGMAIVAATLSFIASQFLSGLLQMYDFHELASDYTKG